MEILLLLLYLPVADVCHVVIQITEHPHEEKLLPTKPISYVGEKSNAVTECRTHGAGMYFEQNTFRLSNAKYIFRRLCQGSPNRVH